LFCRRKSGIFQAAPAAAPTADNFFEMNEGQPRLLPPGHPGGWPGRGKTCQAPPAGRREQRGNAKGSGPDGARPGPARPGSAQRGLNASPFRTFRGTNTKIAPTLLKKKKSIACSRPGRRFLSPPLGIPEFSPHFLIRPAISPPPPGPRGVFPSPPPNPNRIAIKRRRAIRALRDPASHCP